MANDAILVSVVGATGAVGQEIRTQLELLKNENKNLKLQYFASRKRERDPEIKELSFEGQQGWGDLSKSQYILNASFSELALKIRQKCLNSILIDNTSAFRAFEDIPLVVPEVNAKCINVEDGQVVANPNCTAILLCMVLNLLKPKGLERVIVSTYQAASGAGIKGLEELKEQNINDKHEKPLEKKDVFGFPLMGNIISHNSAIILDGEEAGLNGEEQKVMSETRKILALKDLDIVATCMRVPVLRAHLETVTVDLENEVSVDEFRNMINEAPGLSLIDDREKNYFPMPLEAQNQDDVLVGRIRQDPKRKKTIHFILSGDQIRKGAATNAVQIFQHFLDKN